MALVSGAGESQTGPAAGDYLQFHEGIRDSLSLFLFIGSHLSANPSSANMNSLLIVR